MGTWIVLSNEVGVILVVYGSAAETFATHEGKAIRERTGCCVAMHKIVGPKPVEDARAALAAAKERE